MLGAMVHLSITTKGCERVKSLKRSSDRKVAASLTEKGTIRVANSFGLPSGREYSCPGATSVCERVCYAGKLEKVYKGVREALLHNWDLVKDSTREQIFVLLDDMLTEFEAECDRKGADKKFRIHWDGDFFNSEYTRAWAWVIGSHPDIQFWAYTRNTEAAEILRGIPNLTIYFSGDSENIHLAPAGVPVAMLADTFGLAREAVGRGAMCPEQRGQIPLNGACVSCDICLKGKTNVLFSISKK